MAKISSKEVGECCLTRSELFYNDIGKNKLAPEFTKCGSCCSIFFLCAVCSFLVIVLSVFFRSTAADYPFCIFKFFITMDEKMVMTSLY